VNPPGSSGFLPHAEVDDAFAGHGTEETSLRQSREASLASSSRVSARTKKLSPWRLSQRLRETKASGGPRRRRAYGIPARSEGRRQLVPRSTERREL
jgi:hypothetical protein